MTENEKKEPKVIEAFKATLVDLGDSRVEVRIHHHGRDVCHCAVDGLSHMLAAAREIIADRESQPEQPAKGGADDHVGIGENVVCVVKRDPNA